LNKPVVDGVSQIDVAVHASECLQIAERGEPDIKIALCIHERFQSTILQGFS
jgi:hypothetical protein